MTNRHVLRSQRVELPSGTSAADVVVDAGKIQAVAPYGTETDGRIVQDLGSLSLLPGLVDTHVHLNEPGRADWEGFETGTAAAKAGGVTTLVDMPLNSSPVSTTRSALLKKRAAAQGKLHVDVGFHAGLVPGNANQMQALIDAGRKLSKYFYATAGSTNFLAPASLNCGLQCRCWPNAKSRCWCMPS